MLDNIRAGSLIKICHLLLRQPDCIACKFYVDACFSVFALVYDYLVVVLFHCNLSDSGDVAKKGFINNVETSLCDV